MRCITGNICHVHSFILHDLAKRAKRNCKRVGPMSLTYLERFFCIRKKLIHEIIKNVPEPFNPVSNGRPNIAILADISE